MSEKLLMSSSHHMFSEQASRPNSSNFTMLRLNTIILCIFAVLLPSTVTANLVPPQGYSVGFAGTTRRGSQNYACRHGSWIRTGSSASLYAPDGSKLGTYWSVRDPKTRTFTYFWNIINTKGDAAESGDLISGLQGSALRTTQESTSAVAGHLAIVKAHRGSGAAERVAFVSLTGTKDGLSPSKELCSCDGATASVPFTGMFTFYTQDLAPPAPLPASLIPPKNATFVQGLFLEGKMKYKFTGGKWHLLGFLATMADVAGGTILGSVGTVPRPDHHVSNLHWQFKDSGHGFWLSGQPCSKPVPVSGDGFPWQLMKITSSGGTVSPLGPYKFALLAGTLGGKMPQTLASANGVEWSSCFAAQCYLYVAQGRQL